MAEIDWTHLYRRLETTRKALEEGVTPTADRVREMLRSRAESLGAEWSWGAHHRDSIEVLEFLLAHEHYGVETSYIEEVLPLKDLVRLPSAPSFVLGLIHVRGEILSVIDIKKVFGLPDKGLTDLNKVLIVRSGDMEVGILADAILAVTSIATNDLQSAPVTLTGMPAACIRGVTKNALIVLDLQKLLSDKRVLVNEE